MKTLTLTIVIPVYNEESYLKTCLQAIADQTVAPNEVIVVDNNSTDASMDIARQFEFVKIIHEPVQGWIPPRNKGFNTAKSDILARIDADAVLDNHWVEHALRLFADPTIAAVTGPAKTMTLFRRMPYTRLWSLIYFWNTEAAFGIPILWGANMAIRRSAWLAIKDDTCLDDTLVHEDQDLSYMLAGKNLRAVCDNKLTVTTHDASVLGWRKYRSYMRRRITTKKHHAEQGTLTGSTMKISPQRRALLMAGTIPFKAVFVVISLATTGILACINTIRDIR